MSWAPCNLAHWRSRETNASASRLCVTPTGTGHGAAAYRKVLITVSTSVTVATFCMA